MSNAPVELMQHINFLHQSHQKNHSDVVCTNNSQIPDMCVKMACVHRVNLD